MPKIPQYDLPSIKGKWIPAKPSGYIEPYYRTDEYLEIKNKKQKTTVTYKSKMVGKATYTSIALEPADAVKMRQTCEAVWRDYIKWRRSEGYKLWLKRQWAKQNAKCFWCKCSLKGRRHNVEHVVPISRGGTNKSKNLVLSCPDCNKAKGRTMPKKTAIKRATRLNMA